MPPETDAERRPDGTFPRSGRGYRWAPFQENNEAAVKHGATSPRAVLPIADGIAKELLESAPWACRVTYGATVRAWAWAEAQAVLLRTYLHEHGILDGEGVPRPAVGLLERVETRAANLPE